MNATVRRPAVLAATALAVLSLTLTACGGSDGVKDAGAAESAASTSPSKAAAAAAGAVQSETTTGGGGEVGTSGSSAAPTAQSGAKQSGAKQKSGGTAPACTVNDVKISAAKDGEATPTTHITLTATNVSGRSCTLLQYPLIAFSDVIQTAKDVPAVAKSKPAAAVVLRAGAPAYANVRINNGGVDEDNRAVTSFSVNLFAAEGPAEGSKTVSAPKGGIAVDDAVAKTGYWTHELRNGADEF